MLGGKEKVFKDAVHGYIRVPDELRKRFIDTPLFQRLRHIEQTSMRCLYPSARHDRFVHSLGVFHLGTKAFDSLLRNGKSLIEAVRLTEKEVESLRTTFLIACLLHDCAHAPFSHTFEHYYDRGRRLDPILNEAMSSERTAIRDLADCSPAAHEKASAVLILQAYGEDIRALDADPCLAARMVMGCLYSAGNDAKLRLYNAVISLLNGKGVDVDKLDYITRDTWASGVANTSIDLDRLLHAITITSRDPPIISLAYLETALSVLQSVVDARNFLYTWIYGHHKVVYDQYLLTTAVEKVISSIEPRGLEIVFSATSLVERVSLGRLDIFRPIDGDLIHLMNCYGQAIPEAEEWLSRKHGRTALWKSYAQFTQWFGKLDDGSQNRILKTLSDKTRLGEWWKFATGDCLPIVMEPKIKLYEIQENELLVQLSRTRDVIDYRKATTNGTSSAAARIPKFYLYVPNSVGWNELNLVQAVKALA